MASAVIRAPETVQVENEKIDANEMEPLTKGVVFTSFIRLDNTPAVLM